MSPHRTATQINYFKRKEYTRMYNLPTPTRMCDVEAELSAMYSISFHRLTWKRLLQSWELLVLAALQ